MKYCPSIWVVRYISHPYCRISKVFDTVDQFLESWSRAAHHRAVTPMILTQLSRDRSTSPPFSWPTRLFPASRHLTNSSSFWSSYLTWTGTMLLLDSNILARLSKADMFTFLFVILWLLFRSLKLIRLWTMSSIPQRSNVKEAIARVRNVLVSVRKLLKSVRKVLHCFHFSKRPRNKKLKTKRDPLFSEKQTLKRPMTNK